MSDTIAQGDHKFIQVPNLSASGLDADTISAPFKRQLLGVCIGWQLLLSATTYRRVPPSLRLILVVVQTELEFCLLISGSSTDMIFK